ncbi:MULTISPECIES: type I polyketide synthase [Roseomonadaceae]|uniref:SDR family NAD(P)-dependent oxidoreductase n=1 Tax=Falsiroseomonas oleicola TaxID=2801474 RepID=A0ABS6H1R8_9PROT|nr:type I polyketide synthase [Roseomonas oleicola]MBU8542602.1 SDR family NAD(P)-dependent oxidoreductase [Roseomonas oleicola]
MTPARHRRAAQNRSVRPIAILGVGCRLPGAADPASLWSMLAAGRDAVSTLPADRFNQALFLHPRRGEPGRSYTFAAGTIGDLRGFDAGAFGISPREAAEMDPQQRLLLEVTLAAMEDAGCRPSALAGRDIGVFVGGSSTDYSDLRLLDHSGGDRYFMTGNALSILSNRLTNVFDLRGPAETIDTACASSLVALHAACQALADGRLEAAVVAGVQVLLSPFPFVGFSRASMLSPTGRCRAFDAGADGYVRAEGAAAFLLKPLDAALAAGDAIRGVVLASGVSAVGRSIGLSLPSRDAQARLIRQVMADVGATPDRMAYYEAHGTGTQAGDPAEAWAIGQAATGRATPLPVGSIKTNIGHLEPASGVAGLLKAMLVLEKRQVPPSLHQAQPNPNIDFAALNIRVPGTLEDLAAIEQPVAGVNSFGFGGTNAAVLLGPAPPPKRQATPPKGAPQPPLLLSARSNAALSALVASWETRLAAAPVAEVAALARGAARHRDLHAHRLVLRGSDGPALAGALAAWRRAEQRPAAATPGGLCFVFSGNGAQFAGMGRIALATSAPFRAGMARADAALAPVLGWSPLAMLEAGVTAEQLAGTDIAQPLLFAIQVASLDALAAEGLRPDLVLGHSVGEVAAAHAAGLLDLPAAARLVVARSRQQHRTRGQGRMAALGATPAEATALIAEAGLAGMVEIGAINGPAAVTLAGPEAALATLRQAAEAKRHAYVALDLDYAFHSAAMEPVREGLLGDLLGLAGQPGQVPMISTVTGEMLAPEAVGAVYWWRNLRQPVRFEPALRTALAQGARLFLEVGPNPVLQSYIRETARAAAVEAANLVSLSKRDGEGADPFPAIADRAFAAGADPRQGPAFTGPATHGLPPTPLDRKPVWQPETVEASHLVDPVLDHPLLGFRRGEPGVWHRAIDTELFPWLADHRLGADAVLPASGMLDMALAAARARFPEAPALEVAEFRILRAATLEEGRAREFRCTLEAEGGFRIEGRRRLSEEAWALHAEGEVRAATLAALAPPALPPGPGGAPKAMDGATLRGIAARLGLTYGPAFAAVDSVAPTTVPGQVRVRLVLPDSAPPDAAFLLHPSRLDGAMQGLFALLAETPPPPGTGLVPVRFARLVALPGAAAAVTAEVTLTRRGARSATARLVLRDALGNVVARVEDAVFQRFALPGQSAATEAAYRIGLAPAAEGAPPAPALAPALEAARAAAAGLDLTEAALLLEAHVAAAAQGLYAAEPTLHEAAPEASAYEAFLRRALVEDGAAEPAGKGGGGIRLLPDNALPEAAEIWRSVLAEQPGLALDLAWIAEAAERLPEALRGRLRDLPPPPPQGEAMARLAEALAAAVGALAAAWPETRPLRILEVGAASGVLARRVLARLAPLGRALVYVAAGDGRVPLPELPEGMPAGSEIRGVVWDPLGDAPPPLVADLVIGLAPAARARAGSALTTALRPALAEGGALLLVEPLPGRVWTFVCGQDPSWWTGLGPETVGGSAGGALPDAALWLGRLAEAGFRATVAEELACAPWPALLLAAEPPPPPAAAQPAPPRSLILADIASAPLAAALAARLTRRGGMVEQAALEDVPPASALRGARLLLLAAPETSELAERLATVTAIAEAAAGLANGFVLVTQGGQQPAEGVHMPAAAALQGLARVLANEMPALRARRIDLAPGMAPEAAARRLTAELAQLAPEPEVTLGPDARLVPRLQRGLTSPAPGGPLALGIGQPGRLGTLRWEPASLRAPGPGEVVLRVEAAGLNFRDLMWAQGLLPEEVLEAGFAGPTLGMECAGIVEQAGPGVALRPGTRVFGFAPGALAARVVTRVEAIAPLPEGLDPVQAATIPVAFMTALHALETCADLQAGETVLIHGGAGAVGLAALQVAQAIGARIAMTAGSAAKRAFLRAAGAELVLDSRDPGFADALRAAWPEGVDVVLNSLAGEAMERSLGLVKPFGRFVELGKRDYVENRRAPIRPLRRNASYFAVDVDELPRARPGQASRLLGRVRDRLQDGTLRPLPHALFGPEEVEAAFRTLQTSAHIGKLVIRPPAERPAAAAAWAPPADQTIVVVGGTRGFGLATARWLVGQGAKHLALIGRSGGDEAAAALRELSALGARPALHLCDATDAVALDATLKKIRAARPIGGVVHAAAVLDDGAATAMNAARFQRVLSPKLQAAENLDRLTAGDPLGLFLLFSSATTAFGNPGQANYVAANAALEALARRRRAAGRPALAVAWGPIADVGMLADDREKAEKLNRRLGVTAMTAAESLSALSAMLAAADAAPLLVRLSNGEGRLALPIMVEPMLAVLAGSEAPAAGEDLRARLPSLPRPEAEALILRLVTEEIARILRLPPEAVAIDAAVTGLGLDSLGALELRGALEQRLGLQVALAALTEELTVGGLARQIADAALAPSGDEATISTLMESFEPSTDTVRAAE